jgi:hypothetical protein
LYLSLMMECCFSLHLAGSASAPGLGLSCPALYSIKSSSQTMMVSYASLFFSNSGPNLATCGHSVNAYLKTSWSVAARYSFHELLRLEDSPTNLGKMYFLSWAHGKKPHQNHCFPNCSHSTSDVSKFIPEKGWTQTRNWARD